MQTSTKRLRLQTVGIESALIIPMLADPVPPCVEVGRTIRESKQRQKMQP